MASNSLSWSMFLTWEGSASTFAQGVPYSVRRCRSCSIWFNSFSMERTVAPIISRSQPFTWPFARIMLIGSMWFDRCNPNLSFSGVVAL